MFLENMGLMGAPDLVIKELRAMLRSQPGDRKQLDSIADKPQAVAFCRSQRETFRQRAHGFWAREGSLAGWAALDRMAEVVIGADDALTELGAAVEQTPLGQEASPAPAVYAGATTPALIERYTQRWWQVDRAYRRFRAELNSPRGRGLEQYSPRGQGSYVLFQFMNCLGSVILPVIAAAAAESGLIRWTMPPLPMRPLKFLLVVEAQVSPSARTPLLMPRQAPQVGFSTQKPASMNTLINPSSRA